MPADEIDFETQKLTGDLVIQTRARQKAETERDRLAKTIQEFSQWADQLEQESPKPGQGGFFADEIRKRIRGEVE